MRMEFEFEQVVKNGKRGMLLQSAQMFGKNDLPVEYLKGEHVYIQRYNIGKYAEVFFITPPNKENNNKEIVKILYSGFFYIPEEVKSFMEFAYRAGERLHQINKKIRSIKRSWSKTIIYKI